MDIVRAFVSDLGAELVEEGWVLDGLPEGPEGEQAPVGGAQGVLQGRQQGVEAARREEGCVYRERGGRG
jgi:hypothetical protein